MPDGAPHLPWVKQPSYPTFGLVSGKGERELGAVVSWVFAKNLECQVGEFLPVPLLGSKMVLFTFLRPALNSFFSLVLIEQRV